MQLLLRLGVLLLLVQHLKCEEDASHGHYTNEFAVKMQGGRNEAESLAAEHGMKVLHDLSDLGGVYVLSHDSVDRRSRRSTGSITDKLLADSRVEFVEQQKVLKRVKRSLASNLLREKRTILYDKQWELPIEKVHDKSLYQRFVKDGRISNKDNIPGVTPHIADMGFNDPYFRDQWYLINEGQTGGKPGYDLNVFPVWKKGITGKGSVVSILDDGIDYTHPDLAENYDKEASADLNDATDRSNDPMPNVLDSANSHGTRCAGEVAAKANNSNCGVGIAYNARIGGVRMLDGKVTDSLEARALNYHNQYIDVYSASWGPRDDGKTMEGPGRFSTLALKKGVEQGRKGKGSIFIWATGNGGMFDDDCSCDGYVSSIYTLSVGSISDHGLSTYFTEICPSTMAMVFSGGRNARLGDPVIKGSDDNRDALKVKVVTTDLGGECILEFQGTSSAAPLAAGAMALVLEANADLTWRDVQHIVVETARIPNKLEDDGWTLNGAGHHVNNRFGFGVLDVGQMVEAAQGWKNVPPQRQCDVPASNSAMDIPSGGTVNQTLQCDGCHGEQQIDHVEHVQLHIVMSHPKRGDVRLFLTSPVGTVSEMLSLRPLDDSDTGIDFTFMTVHNWDEDPSGSWLLTVKDTVSSARMNSYVGGRLDSWSLTLWGYKGEKGSSNKAKQVRSPKDQQSVFQGTEEAHDPSEVEIKHIFAKEELESENVNIEEGTEMTTAGEMAKSKDSKGDTEIAEKSQNSLPVAELNQEELGLMTRMLKDVMQDEKVTTHLDGARGFHPYVNKRRWHDKRQYAQAAAQSGISQKLKSGLSSPTLNDPDQISKEDIQLVTEYLLSQKSQPTERQLMSLKKVLHDQNDDIMNENGKQEKRLESTSDTEEDSILKDVGALIDEVERYLKE